MNTFIALCLVQFFPLYPTVNSNSELILPGVCVGPVHLFSDRDGVSNLFHGYEIHDTWISPVVGWRIPITRIEDNGNPILDIIWDIEINSNGEICGQVNPDELSNASVYAVRVYSQKYHLPSGFSTASSHSDIRQVSNESDSQILYDADNDFYYLVMQDMTVVLSSSNSNVMSYRIKSGSDLEHQFIPENDQSHYRIQYIDVIVGNHPDSSVIDSTSISMTRKLMGSSITGPPRYMFVDSAAVCVEAPIPFTLELMFHPLEEYENHEYKVDLWVYVNGNGNMAALPYLMNSSGSDMFDRAAQNAALYSTWEPAIREGQSFGAWTVLQLSLIE